MAGLGDAVRTCEVPGCDKKLVAKGLCGSHYEQVHRTKKCDTPKCLAMVTKRAEFCKPCFRARQIAEIAARPPVTEKRCSICGEMKTEEQVDATRWKKLPFTIQCRECIGIDRVARRSGITSKEVRAFLRAEPHHCAICGDTEDLVIDHCHATGKLRGRLCRLCNTLIGVARERADVLESAISYLDERGVN